MPGTEYQAHWFVSIDEISLLKCCAVILKVLFFVFPYLVPGIMDSISSTTWYYCTVTTLSFDFFLITTVE